MTMVIKMVLMVNSMPFKYGTSKTLGINKNAIFRVVIDNDYFKKGDLVKLLEDDLTSNPLFCLVGENWYRSHYIGWSKLEYYNGDKYKLFIKSISE